jgi:hypothetical protein
MSRSQKPGFLFPKGIIKSKFSIFTDLTLLNRSVRLPFNLKRDTTILFQLLTPFQSLRFQLVYRFCFSLLLQ